MPNWMLILISWIIQLTFYIPPNLPRALGKGAVSSYFLNHAYSFTYVFFIILIILRVWWGLVDLFCMSSLPPPNPSTGKKNIKKEKKINLYLWSVDSSNETEKGTSHESIFRSSLFSILADIFTYLETPPMD